MQEDTVKNSELSEKTRSIAYSMKLVNGVYSRLIEAFKMQIKEAEDNEYVMGWNDAFKAVVEMTKSCKYTKKDFLEMVAEHADDSNETAGS